MCDVICAGVEVGFSASDYTVSEGDGVVTVVLQLSGQSDVPVSVLIHTNDGTATGMNDVIFYTMYTCIIRLCLLV